MKISQCGRILAVYGAVTIGVAACTPFTPIKGDDGTEAKLNGSWTVGWVGGAELDKSVSPKPTIVLDTGNKTVSGMDGCNNYKGTYSFAGDTLKAQVAGDQKACPNEAAKAASAQIALLFSEGARVVETKLMGARVLQLKSASAEVRASPSDQGQ